MGGFNWHADFCHGLEWSHQVDEVLVSKGDQLILGGIGVRDAGFNMRMMEELQK